MAEGGASSVAELCAGRAEVWADRAEIGGECGGERSDALRSSSRYLVAVRVRGAGIKLRG